MRSKLIILIPALAIMTGALAWGQQDAEPPWEVRTYLSAWTDEATATTTETYTWNMSVVRKQFVCPATGYSTSVNTVGDTSPDVWASGQAGLEMVPARPLERIAGLLSVGAESPVGYVSNPLIGRPFHPGAEEDPANPDWDNDPMPWVLPPPANVGSYVTARAAGLTTALRTHNLVSVGDRARFLVVMPGAVRAAAKVANSTVPAGWSVQVNPYRVCDGDHWIIRQDETTANQVRIEVYSRLYGKEFDYTITDATQYTTFTTAGCVIITNSGAARILCQSVAGAVAPSMFHFDIEANTCTLPSVAEMDYNQSWYPALSEPSDTGTGDTFPNKAPYILVADVASGPTGCLFTAGYDLDLNDNPVARTDFEVQEKASNGTFTTNECWPYRVPPGATGLGRAMVQWCKGAPGPVTWVTPTAATDPYIYYAPGGEWLYTFDPDAAWIPVVTNEHVANSTTDELRCDTCGVVHDPATYNPGDPCAQAGCTGTLRTIGDEQGYVDCHFMSARVDLPLTRDIHLSGINVGNPAETDIELASGGYTRLIVGDGADPAMPELVCDTCGALHDPTKHSPGQACSDPACAGTLVLGPSSIVGGEYNSGSSTPERPFYAANRDAVATTVCPVKGGGCGTHFLASDYAAGSSCPICGRTLVSEPGDADVQYDTVQPPTVVTDALRHSMPAESIDFGPSNNKVPTGALDFPQTASVNIPRYQPPSVPAGGSAFENNISLDPGYVGTMAAYHRPAEVNSADVVDENHNWDVYYQAPNDGYKQPVAGPHTGSGSAELRCQVCDAAFSTATHSAGGNCPFCSASGGLAAAAVAVPESCLTAEEYDLFDLIVSVTRKVELASGQRAVDLGWVAPGVPQDQPNTVSAAMAAGAEPWPVDVSMRPDFVVRNEGNILTPTQMRAGYLFRPEIDSSLRSWARNGQSVPGTVGTLKRFLPGPAGDLPFPAAWGLQRQEARGAAGMEATARLQAGARDDPAYPGIVKPVPMGQPAGNYTGEVLVYVDLNGNSELDFIDADEGPATTASTEFNADVDEPYEPVAAFSARMRVVEGRLPHNDFYSRDLEPTAAFDDGLTNLQVVWVGNRLSAQGADPSTQPEAGAGTSSAAAPDSKDPFNILYANADVEVADGGLYRRWDWQRDAADELIDATALSGDGAAGVTNSSPSLYLDLDPAATNHRWAMWHRDASSAAGVDSQLRFDSSSSASWSGSDATEFIYGSDPVRFGIKGFATPGAANQHWIFWHTGPKGRESIRYRWDFDPTAAVVTGNEATLPLSNAAAAGGRSDVWYEGPQGFKKPSNSAFTYVKDPSPFWALSMGQPTVHVFFAGYVRAAGNSDICWAKFYPNQMQDRDANFGKQTFPRVANNPYMPVEWANGASSPPTRFAGEELQSDGRRHNFQTAHLDWRVSDDTQDGDADQTNFANQPDPVPYSAGGYGDPQFYLAFVTDDGTGPRQQVFSVYWQEGRYSRSSGTYLVTPRLEGMIIDSGPVYAALPVAPAPMVGHKSGPGPGGGPSWALLDPQVRSTMAAGDDPDLQPSVRMQLDPASGTIRWTASLFNPDDPADPLAVFNTVNTPDLLDVVMYGDYRPFIMRVARDQANDDCPSAFYDLGGSSRLTVFWRRSYSSTDTPHLGRTDFMHKTWTTALQVGRPPIDGAAVVTLTDITPTPNEPIAAANRTIDAANGIITLTEESRIGHVIRVDYTSATPAGAQSEYHRVVGWSNETPVPVGTVVSEGPLRVVPESYQVAVPATQGGGAMDVVRYWLFWSSPRATYDVRDVASDGQQVHQSADVYCAVVAPEYGSLMREVEVPRIGP